MKPGLRTTELYLAIVAVVTLVVNKLFGGIEITTAEALALAITSGVYTIARTLLKAFTAWVSASSKKSTSKK